MTYIKEKELRYYKGFTLVELMVVMALMAVLATFIIGAIQFARSSSVQRVNQENARTIQAALESSIASNKSFCSSADPLPDGMLACQPEITATLGAHFTGNYYSFQEAADILGANISPSKCSSGTKVWFSVSGPYSYRESSVKGGGLVWATPNGYKIRPVNTTCTSALASSGFSPTPEQTNPFPPPGHVDPIYGTASGNGADAISVN